ncbi:hypothetical protein GJAV_G00264780 [Gymnothorax javanicus]|nr:hypothetical protein GJAV_G00264780 [Gymnothorax javanicus]
MHKTCREGNFPAKMHSDPEMSVQHNKEDRSGRQAPQRVCLAWPGQRTLFWCILILVIICAVLLITGVCAGAFMLGRINSQAEKNKEDLLQNIQNVVEMNNFTAEKKKTDLLLSIQNIEERINSQLERNKADLLQNIQNVGENIENMIVEQRNSTRYHQQFGISSWRRFGYKLYYFSTNSTTWEKAREQCVAMGANLAMTKTKEELQFLAKEGKGKYWLGLNDITSEGTWKWLDGSSPAAGLWASGEPNNQFDREDCGETAGELNDVPCDVKRRWICEKSLV